MCVSYQNKQHDNNCRINQPALLFCLMSPRSLLLLHHLFVDVVHLRLSMSSSSSLSSFSYRNLEIFFFYLQYATGESYSVPDTPNFNQGHETTIDRQHTYILQGGEDGQKDDIGREAVLLGEIGTKMIRLDGVNHVHEVPVESMDLGLQLVV